MRLLLVEDEPDLLAGLTRALRKQGYAVDTAADGEEGLYKAGSTDYDAIILDVMLPGIDGYSLQIKLAQEPATKDMPIVVLTSLEPAKSLFQKFPQVVAFMTKPCKPEELLEHVHGALARAGG